MAKPNMFMALSFMTLSLVLFINLAESRFTFPESPSPTPSPSASPARELTCLKVVNVKNGYTCLDISKTFGLGSDVFNAINPNLDCTALFVGQWLCVDGTLS